MNWKQNSFICFKIFRSSLNQYTQRRCRAYKTSLKSAGDNKKLKSISRALEYFDDLYSNVYKEKWPSMRLGLLSTQKYIAVVNNFSDTERIATDLENLGAVNIKRVFEVEAQKLNKKRKSKYLEQTLGTLNVKEKKELLPEKEEVSPTPEYIESSENRLIDATSGMSAASLTEFVPVSKIIGMEDWVAESQHFSHSKDLDIPLTILKQAYLEFPEHLCTYTFEPGNVESFPSPRKGSTNVSDYYLMNGSSLLPVLALDLKPGDNVLDMCAAPGGKSLLCLQTLFPKTLIMNDISEGRINKIKKVMHEFLYDFDNRMKNKEILITHVDGRCFQMENLFNKILVDVPCTTDRLSVTEEDNNIFKSTRVKERIRLPEIQSQLLINALKLVNTGGIVVYSTCSLSPVQNDGVIANALRMISNETNNKYAVIDMKEALQPLKLLYHYNNNLGSNCGHIVVPYVPSNFGPIYFCKILRLE